MAKRIVFCADGTWQLPVSGTNVYKLYKALPISAQQVAFYDDGVGADEQGLERLVTGAFGGGLFQKIKDAYTKIAHVYEKGDELFLFGFSRGSYIARSLAGMIANCGLPTGSFTDDCVDQAFEAYRNTANRATLLQGLGACGLSDCCVRMIGVWDTVGALGIPAIFGGIDEAQFGFLDTGLHPDVKNAFHCLGIDERRPEFPATLWTSEPNPDQTLEQVWFSGCHGDIGGGTVARGGVDDATMLSDITLSWMISKALALGLEIDAGFVQRYTNLPAKYSLDAIHESWLPLFGPPKVRPIPDGAQVSNSVTVRMQYGLTYLPSNLSLTDGALGAGYTVVDVVDETAI